MPAPAAGAPSPRPRAPHLRPVLLVVFLHRLLGQLNALLHEVAVPAAASKGPRQQVRGGHGGWAPQAAPSTRRRHRRGTGLPAVLRSHGCCAARSRPPGRVCVPAEARCRPLDAAGEDWAAARRHWGALGWLVGDRRRSTSVGRQRGWQGGPPAAWGLHSRRCAGEARAGQHCLLCTLCGDRCSASAKPAKSNTRPAGSGKCRARAVVAKPLSPPQPISVVTSATAMADFKLRQELRGHLEDVSAPPGPAGGPIAAGRPITPIGTPSTPPRRSERWPSRPRAPC